MSTLITRIENANARVVSRMTNELVFGTMTAIAARATTTLKTLMCWLCIRRRSLASEQPGRLDRQDQRHRRVEREIGHFGKERLAEIVGQADEQRADGGAAEASHPADDHHCEGDRQHLKVQAGIDAEEGAADDATQRRQELAERENEHGNARSGDAGAARHLRVV